MLGEYNHVVRYKEAYWWEKHVWMVMEYVPGIAISKIPSSSWTYQSVLSTLHQLISILSYFQRKKICHGDFLYSNLFITVKNPTVIVLDFGLAHLMLSSSTSMKRTDKDRFRYTSECKDLVKLVEMAKYLNSA